MNILAATNFLRERIASGAPDAIAKEVYNGLLDVLDPSRLDRRAKGIAVEEPIRFKTEVDKGIYRAFVEQFSRKCRVSARTIDRMERSPLSFREGPSPDDDEQEARKVMG